MSENAADCALIAEAAVEVGKIGLGYFKKDPSVWYKDGNSPVSEADMAIDQRLRAILRSARPDYGWLSEESEDDGSRGVASRLFVVDPIDGTRGFINGHKSWCVSVAVVENGRPVAGVLECPARRETYTAIVGEGAWLNGKPLQLSRSRPAKHEPWRIVGPKSLAKSFRNHRARELQMLDFVPSLAYRLAMIASGEAHAVFVRPNAHDWDLTAADLIVGEARGCLSDIDGNRPLYNRPNLRHGILVASGLDWHDEALDLARAIKMAAQ
ncbi:MAG: 3'(2'),5'-bisphosphate nucleotidase CysQ [Pseudomonadota bacterium]